MVVAPGVCLGLYHSRRKNTNDYRISHLNISRTFAFEVIVLFGMMDRKPAEPTDVLMVVTGGVVESYGVRKVTAETVEAGQMILPRSGLAELVNPHGGRVWIANADLPARIDAEEVRRLRHNAVMKSLFAENGGPDITRTPWQVWGIVLVCLVFLGWAAVS